MNSFLYTGYTFEQEITWKRYRELLRKCREYDPEPGDKCWMLKYQKNRPKGVVRKATVINV